MRTTTRKGRSDVIGSLAVVLKTRGLGCLNEEAATWSVEQEKQGAREKRWSSPTKATASPPEALSPPRCNVQGFKIEPHVVLCEGSGLLMIGVPAVVKRHAERRDKRTHVNDRTSSRACIETARRPSMLMHL